MTLFSGAEVASPDGTLPLGFRLHRLEVFNWGTFDGRVWSFPVDGHTALLTGDIGSGKSTLVDAVTTLLLPAHRVSYNKAAGGTTRERDLRSYVRGYYRSERNEVTGTTRPVALRPGAATYSVVLGVFRNAGFDSTVTLAQVFWTTSNQGQPERFFVVADDELSIAEHFAGFGADITALKRRVRRSGARVDDTFPPYGKAYRRAMSIDSDQAMELFHQTVSMKSVTDLNDFVRSHMLEPFDSGRWIDSLVGHFEDLTRAHDAVLTARRQVEQLTPLLDDASRHEALGQAIAALTAAREHLEHFVAARKEILLHAELETLREQLQLADEQYQQLVIAAKELADRRDALIEERSGAGGDRLGELGRRLDAAEDDRARRRSASDQFISLLTSIGLRPVASREQFEATTATVADAAARLGEDQAAAQEAVNQTSLALRDAEAESKELNDELISLRSRRSNLPRQILDVRSRLCEGLGLDPADLPFAGELIQVRPQDADWEAAAERLLRGFGVSLLVPEPDYAPVSDWIEAHHLGTRLVYYRVPSRVVTRPAPHAGSGELLTTKLQIRDDTPMYEWLEHELQHRAGLVCAASMDEFRRADRALTRAGQIKDRQRHEKNDTHRIDDRSRYVLGWSNEAKIDALLERAGVVHNTLQRLDRDRRRGAEQQSALQTRAASLTVLRQPRTWESIDWQSAVTAISRLEAERRELESSSGELARISKRLDEVETAQSKVDKQKEDANNERGRLRNREQTAVEAVRVCEATMDSTPAPDDATSEFLQARAVKLAPGSPASWDGWERTTRSDLNNEIDMGRSKHEALVRQVERAMDRFRQDFPAQSAEMDAAVGAIAEYRALHARLVQDDLPRFETEFKTYLNTNTIRDVAGFQAELNKQLTLIRDRIATINDSLVGIDYNPGRYILLETQRTPSMEIRQFQTDLRACTEGALGNDRDAQYSELKFLQVKAIIERLRGRTGQTEADRAWTRRVTDVRNWYVFIASERRREDDTEHESYSDSGGKSGGQKEKLAYTILAASLAYQFKLDWGVERSKTFRFVVIDEAFGRGSDESTRYGLSLFARLGLQLVIVTPLQKIPVIEPYVQRVGFVDNRSGSSSQLQTLTIEEFRNQHNEHRRLAAAALHVQIEA